MPKVFYKIMAVWDIALYSELTLKQFFLIHGHTKIKRSIASPAGCYPFFNVNCNSVMCLSMHFLAIVRHSKHFFMFYHFVDMILPTKAFNNTNIYANPKFWHISLHSMSLLICWYQKNHEGGRSYAAFCQFSRLPQER